jgi:DNA-binding MarR family transcriptional regulator
MSKPRLIEHIGWDLHRVNSMWKTKFHQKMVARGCGWMGEARGVLLQHVGPGGIGQNILVQKSGLTKQAIQQHLDGLVQDGIVVRVVDENDARQKRVQLTQRGMQSAQVANDVKIEIEGEFREAMGDAQFDTLVTALRVVIDLDAS